jgi:hypothetical protein
MSPNLEQTGLLRIDYESLTDLCSDRTSSTNCGGACPWADDVSLGDFGKPAW